MLIVLLILILIIVVKYEKIKQAWIYLYVQTRII